MNPEQLTLAIGLFETKIEELEVGYKEKHKEDFNNDKMKRYINRKLKREINILAFYNLTPSIEVLKNTERFKY